MQNLGRVLPVLRGTWNATTAYTHLDIVNYQGSSYVCDIANTGNSPDQSDDWALLAQRGNDVDLSVYAKASDLQSYAKQDALETVKSEADANSTALTTKLTSADLKGYAKISDIPGQVDLSGYATTEALTGVQNTATSAKAEADANSKKLTALPEVKLDTANRSITVGSNTLKIAADVDLSGYATKDQLDSTTAIAQANSTALSSANGAIKQAQSTADTALTTAKAIDLKPVTSTANQALKATQVQVVTSGTLADLKTGKYEVQASLSDAPTDDWGMCDVEIGQHYAKQTFTITGNGHNLVYSRIKDYDTDSYSPWKQVTADYVADSDGDYYPEAYRTGTTRYEKGLSNINIDVSTLADDAQDGTVGLLTAHAYTVNGTQYVHEVCEVLDSKRPLVFVRNGTGKTWYDWELITPTGLS